MDLVPVPQLQKSVSADDMLAAQDRAISQCQEAYKLVRSIEEFSPPLVGRGLCCFGY
jgi:hypothetical protein